MKRLNNKGYLTVEIILAAVIAFTIAFFLIEITVNFSNASDDYYVDTIFITDKSLIIDNIKKRIQEDINDKGIIKGVSCTSSSCDITYDNGDHKSINYNINKEIEYGDYKKKIDNVKINSMNVYGSFNEGDYIRFVISFDNTFTDSNYDINILIYNEIFDDSVIPESPVEPEPTCINDGNKYDVFIYVDGDYLDNFEVNSCDYFENVVSVYTTYVNISCTNNQDAYIDIVSPIKVKAIIENVTSDTECYIEYD